MDNGADSCIHGLAHTLMATNTFEMFTNPAFEKRTVTGEDNALIVQGTTESDIIDAPSIDSFGKFETLEVPEKGSKLLCWIVKATMQKKN